MIIQDPEEQKVKWAAGGRYWFMLFSVFYVSEWKHDVTDGEENGPSRRGHRYNDVFLTSRGGGGRSVFRQSQVSRKLRQTSPSES